MPESASIEIAPGGVHRLYIDTGYEGKVFLELLATRIRDDLKQSERKVGKKLSREYVDSC